MHARHRPVRFAHAALAACALAASPAWATVLYKSITASGVVQFSDTPPENAVIVEQRPVGEPSNGQPVFGIAGLPSLAFANPLEAVAEGAVPDEALAQANAKVDLAEHALALARNSARTRREGLRLHSGERTSADRDRIAFYERNLKLARAHLLELMKKMGTVPFFSLAEQEPPAKAVLAGR